MDTPVNSSHMPSAFWGIFLSGCSFPCFGPVPEVGILGKSEQACFLMQPQSFWNLQSEIFGAKILKLSFYVPHSKGKDEQWQLFPKLTYCWHIATLLTKIKDLMAGYTFRKVKCLTEILQCWIGHSAHFRDWRKTHPWKRVHLTYFSYLS